MQLPVRMFARCHATLIGAFSELDFNRPDLFDWGRIIIRLDFQKPIPCFDFDRVNRPRNQGGQTDFPFYGSFRASGSGGTAGMLCGGPVSPPCGHIARGQLRAKGARYPRTTAAEVTVRAHHPMRPQSSRDYARKMCVDFSERRLRRAHERRGRLGGETP